MGYDSYPQHIFEAYEKGLITKKEARAWLALADRSFAAAIGSAVISEEED